MTKKILFILLISALSYASHIQTRVGFYQLEDGYVEAKQDTALYLLATPQKFENVKKYHFEMQKEDFKDSVAVETRGFKIQLFKTESFNDAKEKEFLYKELLGEDEVVLIYDKPFYKIRYGNFENKADALRSKSKISSFGLSNLIIVPDKIILKMWEK